MEDWSEGNEWKEKFQPRYMGMWPLRVLLNEYLVIFMGFVVLLGLWSLGGSVRLDMFLGWLNWKIHADSQGRELLRNTKVEDRKGEG